jgi:hypothetical protein
MSVTGEFSRYLDVTIDACRDAQGDARFLRELEAAREGISDDLVGAARRAMIALEAHVPDLDDGAPHGHEAVAVAGRDLATVSRLVLGR